MDEAVIQSAELVVRELTEIVTNKVLILIFSSILERNESFSKKKKQQGLQHPETLSSWRVRGMREREKVRL